MDDTAATLQQEYDQAVYLFGADSVQAQAAEQAAKEFQKGKPSPVTMAIQQKENHVIFS